MAGLRAHQRESVDAAVHALESVSSAGAGLRATIVSACGTGKTFMGAHTALRVAGTGRVLVLVPTLDLLVQTFAAWWEAGRAGALVAVCSLHTDAELAAAGVRCTTDARRLLEWAGGAARVTVFATYASLPVLAEAHRAGLRRWDLVVVDEAHRPSGPWGKPWAAVHDDAVLPGLGSCGECVCIGPALGLHGRGECAQNLDHRGADLGVIGHGVGVQAQQRRDALE